MSIAATVALPISTDERTELRLRLGDPNAAGGQVARGSIVGQWWPRSLDLSTELRPLVTAMWSAGYEVFRVIYNLTAWDAAPRKMRVAGRLIKLGGYRGQDAGLLTLLDVSGRKCVDLTVIWPQADQLLAESTLAGQSQGAYRNGEALKTSRRTGVVELLPSADWETDGGRVLRP